MWKVGRDIGPHLSLECSIRDLGVFPILLSYLSIEEFVSSRVKYYPFLECSYGDRVCFVVESISPTLELFIKGGDIVCSIVTYVPLTLELSVNGGGNQGRYN